MGEQPPPQATELVQCEMTGRWVPPDEIVEIQGHKVCAEGKEELLEKLKSGEMLPGEMERPTILRRFCCIFLDGIVLRVPLALINVALTVIIRKAFDGADASMGLQAPVQMFGVIVGLCYFGLMHGTRGQTLGKMAGKIKVVNLDGSDITMGKAFLRALFYQGPLVIAPLLMLFGVVGMFILVPLSILAGVYMLVNVIFALVDRAMQRALHDRLAGTRVIMVG